MANYLDEAGLAHYDELLKAYFNTALEDEVGQAVADLAGALQFKGLISTTDSSVSMYNSPYANAKVGDVYFVSADGVKLNYYDGAGKQHSAEVMEKGDAIVCLQAMTGSTSSTQHWGTLQVNWNVVANNPTLSWGGISTIGSVGGKELKVTMPSLGNNKEDIAQYGSGAVTANAIYEYVTNGFVAKSSGKGLSTNDYTNADKAKVDALKGASKKEVAGQSDITDYVAGNNQFADYLPTVEAVTGYFKPKQTAKSSPSASGNAVSFIDTITQNANGVITATKKTVQSASASQAGLMSSAHYSKLEGIAAGATADEPISTAYINSLFATDDSN
jgi:hypothetical protein